MVREVGFTITPRVSFSSSVTCTDPTTVEAKFSYSVAPVTVWVRVIAASVTASESSDNDTLTICSRFQLLGVNLTLLGLSVTSLVS